MAIPSANGNNICHLTPPCSGYNICHWAITSAQLCLNCGYNIYHLDIHRQ